MYLFLCCVERQIADIKRCGFVKGGQVLEVLVSLAQVRRSGPLDIPLTVILLLRMNWACRAAPAQGRPTRSLSPSSQLRGPSQSACSVSPCVFTFLLHTFPLDEIFTVHKY